jgi:hypothetical protein
MAVFSTGNEAKGGKQPVKKAGKAGRRAKVTGDKTGGSEGKRSAKNDHDLIPLAKDSGRNNELMGDDALGTETAKGSDKTDHARVLKTIVQAREKEINDIELRITGTCDIRERSILAVQLKGALHALKEALVSMSLVQKKAEEASVDVAWSSDGDTEMKETTYLGC